MKSCAPIIIPTLCRYNLLKRCLESLSSNSLASETDVYIGLDYPSKLIWRDGYNKILNYLENTKFPFRKFILCKREDNLGPFENTEQLFRQYILPNYDAWIYSEDDNEFSPNFLEFINKGLEKFHDDKSVLALSGYTHPYPLHFNNNNFFAQNVDFSAWGYATWIDRYKVYDRLIRQPDYFRGKIYNPLFIARVWRNGSNRLSQFIEFSKQDYKVDYIYDELLSVYMALENMKQIMPKVSLVRNNGWDGSGVHCGVSNNFSKQIIDDNKYFDFIGEDTLYNKNRKRYVHGCYGFRKMPFILIKRWLKLR